MFDTLVDDRIANSVARAWRAVLGQNSLDANDAFDSSGGDSLAWLRLINMIEEDLGQAIDLEAVRLTHTPTELAAAIERQGTAAASRPKGPLRVFMVPVAGGDGPGQAALRAGCAGRVDLELVTLPHWATVVDPNYRFETLVRFVADQILARGGDGPVLLAGYCFGGAIAAAVARRLHAQGRVIGLLAILDGDLAWFQGQRRSSTVRLTPWQQARSLRWAWQSGRLAEYLGRVAAESLALRHRWLLPWLVRRERYKRLPSGFAFYLNLHLLMQMLPGTDRPGLIRELAADVALPIPVGVFRTPHHDPGRPEDLGWSALFQPAMVHFIEGTHEGVFAPAVIDGLCESFVSWVQQVAKPSGNGGSAR